MTDAHLGTSSVSKHDAECLSRRDEVGLYLCTCDMTDEQVAEAIMKAKVDMHRGR